MWLLMFALLYVDNAIFVLFWRGRYRYRVFPENGSLSCMCSVLWERYILEIYIYTSKSVHWRNRFHVTSCCSFKSPWKSPSISIRINGPRATSLDKFEICGVVKNVARHIWCRRYRYGQGGRSWGPPSGPAGAEAA